MKSRAIKDKELARQVTMDDVIQAALEVVTEKSVDLHEGPREYIRSLQKMRDKIDWLIKEVESRLL